MSVVVSIIGVILIAIDGFAAFETIIQYYDAYFVNSDGRTKAVPLMIEKFGEDEIKNHYADTRDTLCYATNDNQQSTFELLNQEADLAIVVGGYNSSNTSHLADLCATKFKTFFVNGPEELIEKSQIRHFDYATKSHLTSNDYLPNKEKVSIVVTSGASCPDSVIESVIDRLLSFYPSTADKATALQNAGVIG